MLNKMIEAIKKYAEPNRKIFLGANIVNNFAYLSNNKIAFVLPTQLNDGYYDGEKYISEDILKIDKPINGISIFTKELYDKIKPTQFVFETIYPTKELLRAIEYSQQKLKPEQLYSITEKLSKKEISEFKKYITPSDIMKFTIKDKILHINDMPFLPITHLENDIQIIDTEFYVDINNLKSVLMYSENIEIRYAGYNKPILFIADTFNALVMPMLPKFNNQYSKNGRNYSEHKLALLKKLLKKEYNEILEMLDNCYEINASKKSENQIYKIVKQFPDIISKKEGKIKKLNRYIYTTIENGFLYITNGVCLLKLKSNEATGSYINADVLDTNKPITSIKEITSGILPIVEKDLRDVTPEYKNINSKIGITKDDFLKCINRTKFKIKGLEASNEIEIKVKNNVIYINNIYVSDTTYSRDLVLYFDNRYFDLLNNFGKDFVINIYNDIKVINVHHSPIVITDFDNNTLLLMPMVYDDAQIEELSKYFITINGIRIDTRLITEYCKVNNLTEYSVKEMILNNSFKKD